MKLGPQGAPPTQPVQLKFQPKVRPRKAPKATIAKEEPLETKDDIINKELLAKINKSQTDALGRRFPKNEKKGYKLQYVRDAGAENIDDTISNNSYNVSDPEDMDNFHAILCTVDIVIDQTYVLVPAEYKLSTFLENIDIGDNSCFGFLTNQSLWRYDKRVQKSGSIAAPSEVAFGHGNSGLARSFPRVAAKGKLNQDNVELSAPHFIKDYVEPWDYAHTYYPTVVPLRRPYSGDPDILDEEEFGEASTSTVSDESQINHALELGLMEKKEEPQMLFFQFPTKLPLMKQEDVAAGMKQSAETGAVSKSKIEAGSKKGCKLEDLPPGLMGKIMVYKSGKIKMKLGDAIFDISAGSNFAFAQDVAAINTKEKHCCILGDIARRAVVTPDVDSLIDSLDLEAT